MRDRLYPCLADEGKLMNGPQEESYLLIMLLNWILARGSSISVLGFPNVNIKFYVDINGQKGSNIIGHDILALLIDKN